MKQIINILLKNVKKMVLKNCNIQKLLLNIQTICKIFIKLMKIATQAERVLQ